jgi:hypothetical protein
VSSFTAIKDPSSSFSTRYTLPNVPAPSCSPFRHRKDRDLPRWLRRWLPPLPQVGAGAAGAARRTRRRSFRRARTSSGAVRGHVAVGRGSMQSSAMRSSIVGSMAGRSLFKPETARI